MYARYRCHHCEQARVGCYTCPYCDEEVSEPFDSFCSDIWSGYCMTRCPKCDKDVMLEEVEYD